MKICSHTLVVGEKMGQLSPLLHWHVTTNQQVNVEMLNMPEGRGQKGGVLKQKSARNMVPEPEQIISIPSLTTTSSGAVYCTNNAIGSHLKNNIGQFSDIY